MDINDEYSIICELAKGSYLYKLYRYDELIYKHMDRHKPYELPKRSGNIKKLMDKINYNIIDEKQLHKQKMDDLDKIINELEISLKQNEIVFDDYQMTNNRVYTQNNNIIFNFIITEVIQKNDLFEITFKNSIEEFTLFGSINNIIEELNNKFLINKSIINYKFVFKTLLSLVIENENS